MRKTEEEFEQDEFNQKIKSIHVNFTKSLHRIFLIFISLIIIVTIINTFSDIIDISHLLLIHILLLFFTFWRNECNLKKCQCKYYELAMEVLCKTMADFDKEVERYKKEKQSKQQLNKSKG